MKAFKLCAGLQATRHLLCSIDLIAFIYQTPYTFIPDVDLWRVLSFVLIMHNKVFKNA